MNIAAAELLPILDEIGRLFTYRMTGALGSLGRIMSTDQVLTHEQVFNILLSDIRAINSKHLEGVSYQIELTNLMEQFKNILLLFEGGVNKIKYHMLGLPVVSTETLVTVDELQRQYYFFGVPVWSSRVPAVNVSLSKSARDFLARDWLAASLEVPNVADLAMPRNFSEYRTLLIWAPLRPY